ncbi:hypothetical protein CR513_27310, partial [Mucuna pruriens]
MKRIFLSSFRHLELPPSEKKYERLCMNIGRDLITLCHLSTPSDQRTYFYKGLLTMDRSMIDKASGGAFMDKPPTAARHLISNMGSNTQQFGVKGLSPSQLVSEIGTASNQRLENQLTELTSLVRQLAVEQHQPTMVAKVCGICTSMEHPTDVCLTLQEIESDQPENVGAIGGFQYGKQLYQIWPFDNQ